MHYTVNHLTSTVCEEQHTCNFPNFILLLLFVFITLFYFLLSFYSSPASIPPTSLLLLLSFCPLFPHSIVLHLSLFPTIYVLLSFYKSCFCLYHLSPLQFHHFHSNNKSILLCSRIMLCESSTFFKTIIFRPARYIVEQFLQHHKVNESVIHERQNL